MENKLTVPTCWAEIHYFFGRGRLFISRLLPSVPVKYGVLVFRISYQTEILLSVFFLRSPRLFLEKSFIHSFIHSFTHSYSTLSLVKLSQKNNPIRLVCHFAFHCVADIFHTFHPGWCSFIASGIIGSFFFTNTILIVRIDLNSFYRVSSSPFFPIIGHLQRISLSGHTNPCNIRVTRFS